VGYAVVALFDNTLGITRSGYPIHGPPSSQCPAKVGAGCSPRTLTALLLFALGLPEALCMRRHISAGSQPLTRIWAMRSCIICDIMDAIILGNVLLHRRRGARLLSLQDKSQNVPLVKTPVMHRLRLPQENSLTAKATKAQRSAPKERGPPSR